MKNATLKRICSLLLAVLLLAGMLGCAAKDPAAPAEDNTPAENTPKDPAPEQNDAPAEEEAQEPVILEWYYAGNGIQKDTQKIEDRVNELLKDYEGLEHVQIHLNCIARDDYAQQILLNQTAGKQMDIIHCYRLNYADEINNGTYLALDDMLATDEFADLRNELPQWLWKTLQVNGQTYIVPGYQMAATDRYLIVPTEYMQYADADVLNSIELSDAASVTTLCDQIEKITKSVIEATGMEKYAMPLGEGIALTNTYIQKDILEGGSGTIVPVGSTEVTNVYMTDAFKEACRIAAKWVEEGLLPSDAAVRDVSKWENGYLTSDQACAVATAQTTGDNELVGTLRTAADGYDVTAIKLHEHYFIQRGWGAGGNGVTATCEHPVEALRFLQAINTEKGKEIYNTIVYGLEGVHYEKLDDNHIKTLEYDGTQGGTDTSYAAWKWVIGNTKYVYLNQACTDNDAAITADINDNPENPSSKLMGFVLDLEPVSTQVAQCAAVVTEYRPALTWGSKGAEWEAYYEEFIDKLQLAGAQEIIDEVQSQIDAWLSQK